MKSPFTHLDVVHFHTIKSILNQNALNDIAYEKTYFHTIKSILNPDNVSLFNDSVI